MQRRDFLLGSGTAAALTLGSRVFAQAASASTPSKTVGIDARSGSRQTPFPHFWTTAGSDRTAVGLRDQWRQDLLRVHRDAGIKSIRSHGLFNDEMAIAARGVGNYNFLYVDQVYDFMLDNGVRPFVELSFMPEAMARSANRIFFYKGNVSPPKRWSDWRDMVQAFTDHVVKRYGISEVSGWKFEVWNEPNIGFWAGTQDEYFELYRQSALAVKAVDRRLQVGGPATAQLAWIPDLIRFCANRGVPLDFLTTHVYPSDPQNGMFGKANKYPIEQVIPRGLDMIKQQVSSSAMPDLPVWLTEWGSQDPAFIADTIKNCVGLTEGMSYWTFSNVFEELGPPSLFNNTFGMLDQSGIARPSFHTFAMLHRLGETRLDAGDGPVLATRKPDGSLAILVWNLAPTKGGALASGNPLLASGGGVNTNGPDLDLSLRIGGWKGKREARVSHVNGKVGSGYPAWVAMGKPPYPSGEQLEALRKSAELPEPSRLKLSAGDEPTLDLRLPPNGIALVEIGAR